MKTRLMTGAVLMGIASATFFFGGSGTQAAKADSFGFSINSGNFGLGIYSNDGPRYYGHRRWERKRWERQRWEHERWEHRRWEHSDWDHDRGHRWGHDNGRHRGWHHDDD